MHYTYDTNIQCNMGISYTVVIPLYIPNTYIIPIAQAPSYIHNNTVGVYANEIHV